ncbi:MAG TPA: MBL fold metallo-hydrolase [Lachnospiraceae bacterium]|nr:MBL fold metallo-hydrolase [Lachnospiraceae bacterium]
MRFCPVVSGSSGNSVYIGTDYTHLLIDAGVSGKIIQAGLSVLNVEGAMLDGIFVTHEHSDHIKGVGVLSRRFDLPIYATEGTWNAMENSLGQIARKNKKIIYSGEKLEINDLVISPFDIPHDAAEPVGYSVMAGDIKMTVATDLGHITDSVKNGIADSDILLLEANHDINMLKSGTYPYSLKQRILGEFGHLANENAGRLLSQMTTKRLKHVFLGHLSAENNTPSLAYKAVENILNENGIKVGRDFSMEMASRHSVSRCIEL